MNTKAQSMTTTPKPMPFATIFSAAKAPRWLAALGIVLATAWPALAQCPTNFALAANFAAGTNPESVAVGDFNGDGRPDLAVANVNNGAAGSVSILLGTGTGAFGAATNFLVGTNPLSVAAADFNGDGRPDLAVANSSSFNVSILLGTGTGTFGAATNFAAGTEPRSVAVGDFNGDGRPDLAVANFISNNVSILLGTGTGTFGAATNLAVGTAPVSVAVRDFNGDGRPDLSVANNDSNNVSILLGTGTGSFGAATNFAVGNTPIFVAVGDFNGDGKPDLSVANEGSNNVSVLLNTTPNAVVSEQPAPVSVCPSGTANFSITASGTTPAYQWQWQPAGPDTDWAALIDGINADTQGTPAFDVSGATTPNVGVRSIRGLGGNFRCIVTNACGSVTSNAATLTIEVCCDSIDFNNDTSFFDPTDIEAFLSVFSEGPCVPEIATCNDIDFNNDGGLFDPCDVGSFLRVYSEGPCTPCGQ